jgi:polyferredoxin
MSILSPQLLLDNIELISQIISVMLLVIFDDFFTEKVAFGGTDMLKSVILEKAKEKFRKKYRILIKYSFEFITTIVFIAYFFAGYWVLSEYVVTPILNRMSSIILIVIVLFFLVTSWLLNNRKLRRKYLGYR